MSGRPVDEAGGVGCACVVEHLLALGDDGVGEPVVHLVGREKRERAVVVVVVVPAQQRPEGRARVLDTAEALGQLGAVLERLEVRLREGLSSET